MRKKYFKIISLLKIHVLGIVLLGVLNIVAGMAQAQALSREDFYWVPYFGIDTQLRQMSFRKDYGAKCFRSLYPQINGFIGVKICDYLGFEMGYFLASETREAAIASREMSMGIQSSMPLRITSTAKIEGWHFNVITYLPMFDNDKLTAFGFIGLANIYLQLTQNYTEGNGIPINVVVRMQQRKTILRSGLGLLHMLNEWVGLRGTLTYENTASLNSLSKSRNSKTRAKLNDSILLGLGVFVRF